MKKLIAVVLALMSLCCTAALAETEETHAEAAALFDSAWESKDFRAEIRFDENEWKVVESEFVPKDEKNVYDLYFQTLIRQK